MSRKRSEDVLASLDTNVTPHQTSVKRKRLSLLPSNVTIGAPRLVRPPPKRQSSIGMNVPGSARRMGGARTARRRVSLYPQQRGRYGLPSSSAGHLLYDGTQLLTPQRLQNNASLPKPNVDPRPLRDRNFQSQMQKELLEWLTSKRFEIEMKTQLSSRTLRSPTQKEFVTIFQFMYHKIDPGYKFVRSVEQEIYAILKFIDYPYLENINKSQLSAVGGSNWPTFLGMVYWLMQLVQQVQDFDSIDIDAFQEQVPRSTEDESTVFSEKAVNDSVIVRENTALDRLFTTFALKSYKKFLEAGSEDYTEFLHDMQREYGKSTQDVADKKQALDADNERLAVEIESRSQEARQLHSKAQRTKVLETDVSKLQKYVDLQRQRSEKWPVVLEKANADIETIKANLASAEQEKSQIEDVLKEKGFTVAEIRKMHCQRMELTTTTKSIESDEQHISSAIDEKTAVLQQRVSELTELIESYNAQVHDILDKVDLPTDLQLVVSFSPEDITPNATPEQIVPNLDATKEVVSGLKDQIDTARVQSQEQQVKLEETLDDLQLQVVSQQDALQETEDGLDKSKRNYTEFNDQKTAEVNLVTKQLVDTTAALQEQSTQVSEYGAEIDNKYNEAERKVRQLSSQLGSKRNGLLIEVANKMEQVVTLKTGIMANLEATENAIASE